MSTSPISPFTKLIINDPKNLGKSYVATKQGSQVTVLHGIVSNPHTGTLANVDRVEQMTLQEFQAFLLENLTNLQAPKVDSYTPNKP